MDKYELFSSDWPSVISLNVEPWFFCHHLPLGTWRREQQRGAIIEWFMEDVYKGHLWHVRRGRRKNKRVIIRVCARDWGLTQDKKLKHKKYSVVGRVLARNQESGFQFLFWYWLIETYGTHSEYIYSEWNLLFSLCWFLHHCKRGLVFVDTLILACCEMG